MRGSEMVERLLSYTKNVDEVVEVISPSNFIKDYLEVIRRMVGGSIDIEGQIAGDCWNVKADVGQLENALLNITIKPIIFPIEVTG